MNYNVFKLFYIRILKRTKEAIRAYLGDEDNEVYGEFVEVKQIEV